MPSKPPLELLHPRGGSGSTKVEVGQARVALEDPSVSKNPSETFPLQDVPDLKHGSPRREEPSAKMF